MVVFIAFIFYWKWAKNDPQTIQALKYDSQNCWKNKDEFSSGQQQMLSGGVCHVRRFGDFRLTSLKRVDFLFSRFYKKTSNRVWKLNWEAEIFKRHERISDWRSHDWLSEKNKQNNNKKTKQWNSLSSSPWEIVSYSRWISTAQPEERFTNLIPMKHNMCQTTYRFYIQHE